MERIPNCCAFASLVALVILVSFPVRSWCEEDVYKSLTEPEFRDSEAAELKRFDDIDYDTFVSLMGRRSAPRPNSRRNTQQSRKRDLDHVFADSLGRKTRMACPCAQEYLQARRGRFIAHDRQRF